jgi:chaperonin GroEL
MGGEMLYVKSKAKEMVDSEENIGKIVQETISRASKIVGSSLGPGGRPVLLARGDMPPLVSKDGVTILKHIGFPSAPHNIVLDVCKEISLNVGRDAGDGTTTAIVLAEAIYRHGQTFIRANPKYNPQRFMRELKTCYTTVVIPTLTKEYICKKVETEADLMSVALISANGDKDIADAVVKAVIAAGDEGTVLVQEDQGGGMRVETIDGYIVTSGLKELGSIGTAFINDRAGQQVSMDAGLTVMFDGSLNDLVLLGRIQDAFESTPECFGKPIVIFAHSFADPVIEKCLKTSKSGVTVLPVKVPKSGLPNSRTIFLQDMAVYTGGTVMDPASAPTFEPKDFGEFKKARVNTYEAFIQAVPDTEALDARVEELKSIMASAFSEHDKAHLRSHLGKLTGGISTVWVGGITDAEIRERKDRVQDAIEAVRSAVAEGVVAGGGITHRYISEAIEACDQYKPSWEVMVKALRAPFDRIMENCGEADRADGVWASMPDYDMIFDADAHESVDAWAAGIIEPAKVHRVAIGNALSIASLLVTLGGIITECYNPELESQMELSKMAFKDALGQSDVGQE